jgi:hypothetical protein
MNAKPRRAWTRDELYQAAEDYLAALVARDPSRLAWAQSVAFSENNVRLRLPDGLWNTVSGRRSGYDLKFADLSRGQVGWFGIVEEHGHPARMALRLALDEAGRIAEVETIVVRDQDNSPFPDCETYPEPRSLLLTDVPEPARRPRERMVSIADGYFDTIQLNDGQLFTEFTDDCDRIENGVLTTNNAAQFGESYPIAALGCAEQFRMGHYRFDDRLRDRRFPLVDEEKGLVLAGGFIDHEGRLVDITWTDGTRAKSVFHYPHSFNLLELFKIVDGKIAAVEAVFVSLPYNMVCAWNGPSEALGS